MGKDGNEFDTEAMSPIMQIYVRDTFIHKDEETLKTSIRLENIKGDPTCLGGDGDEFEKEEKSPIMLVSVRESLMK